MARGSELARGRGETRGQGTLGVVARRPLVPPRQRREAPHKTNTQTSRRATEDKRAVRGPRRRIARALGRGRRGAIQRGDPGYRARAPGPTGTAVRHHHTPRHGGGARLFGDELSDSVPARAPARLARVSEPREAGVGQADRQGAGDAPRSVPSAAGYARADRGGPDGAGDVVVRRDG